MQPWNLDRTEVAEADAAPWDGPLAGLTRPLSTATIVWLSFAATTLFCFSAASALVLERVDGEILAHRGPWLVYVVVTFAFSVTAIGFLLVLPPLRVRRWMPVVATLMLFLTPPFATVGVVGAGPAVSVIAATYVQAPIFAFIILRRRWAVGLTLLVVGFFTAVVLLQEGWTLGAWALASGNIIGTSVIAGLIAVRADQLASVEHDLRLELADLNENLERRVEAQVGEIERLGGLRRFLSPQIADAVLAGRAAEIEAPHRRRIAVVFCDLRGFTAFTNSAEPEEVIEVLDEYYRTVGGLLQRYDATLGDYAGDGIMAYFGDPVPRDDAALAAVAVAAEIVRAMEPVSADWRRRGYELGFGVGIAHGYATLGVVGFDGRYDYKPVGGVVNLAARLCAHAGAGEVLLDHATYAETAEHHPAEPVPGLELKGYGSSTRAYRLS